MKVAIGYGLWLTLILYRSYPDQIKKKFIGVVEVSVVLGDFGGDAGGEW
jgi:hypothetical protein